MDDIYKNYFESMPCFLSVQDRDLNIIHANQRFIDKFGPYEGRCCYQVYKQRPEKCEACSVERTFRDGLPHYSEEVVKTLDGEEVWVIVNTTPIRDESGQIIGVMEMSTDVTEIKQLQNQLKESQTRYKTLFEETPCFISMQDKELNITEANRLHREAFGTDYGNKCYKVYKHRTKECQPCPVRKTFADGIVRTHEEVVTSQDDEQINVLVRTAPVRNVNGEVDMVLEVGTDITRIRQLQDKLTSVGLLIGSISHGIKGLLNGLDGGIYLVNSGIKTDNKERINRGWEIALRNVDRIRSMVMDILYYAKDRKPELSKVSAGDILKDVCLSMEDKAKKLNLDFVYDIAPEAGDFEVDPQAVRSLLMNLLENSFDACRVDTKKSEHKVEVNLKGASDHVLFEFKDDGIGMDQETREKAFSLFFSSKGAGGTGLGLFISNKIVQSHGGTIHLESEEDKGTSFLVKLMREYTEVHVEEDAILQKIGVEDEETGSAI